MEQVLELIAAGDLDGARALQSTLNAKRGLSGEDNQLIDRALDTAEVPEPTPSVTVVIGGDDEPEAEAAPVVAEKPKRRLSIGKRK